MERQCDICHKHFNSQGYGRHRIACLKAKNNNEAAIALKEAGMLSGPCSASSFHFTKRMKVNCLNKIDLNYLKLEYQRIWWNLNQRERWNCEVTLQSC